VEERLDRGRGVEIAGLLPEVEVREAEQRVDQRSREALEIRRREEKEREDEAGGERRQHRRQETPRPAQVEAGEAESALPATSSDQPGDEEAGDDEEHVDADEAA
jgi:hypothetical protein